MLRLSAQERELLRFGWRLEDHPAPVGNSVDRTQACHRFRGRLGECRIKTGLGHIRLDRADTLSLRSGIGDIARLNYAKRLFAVPIAILGQAVGQASLPFFSRLFGEKKFAEFAATVKIGHGMEDGIDIGPIQNRAQYDLVNAMVREAVENGANVLYQSPVPPGPGLFLPITILTNVTPAMRVVKVVTSTRCPLTAHSLHSAIRSST